MRVTTRFWVSFIDMLYTCIPISFEQQFVEHFFLINELAVKWWISQVAVVAFVAWVCQQWLWPSGSAMIIEGRQFGCSW